MKSGHDAASSPPSLEDVITGGITGRDDHDELAALAESVMKTIIAGDRDIVATAIAELQARVRAHMDAEERDLFARYARYAPQDANELLIEHAQIRQVLAELDIALDLHLVRADAIGAFLTAFQKHSERENAGLYRWAAHVLDT